MDLRALAVVVAIAEQGSVKRAGSTLHQSPSSVSHALLGLEAELGVQLFHRLPHGMALTDAGEVFVVAARRTLHEAEIARATVDDVRGLVSGHLCVVAVRAFTVPLADLIARYASRHPGVLVSVLPPGTEAGVVEEVRNGACEVGITRSGRIPIDLDSVVVGAEKTVAVVPDGHRLAERTSITMRDLEGERMVAPLADSAMRPYFDDVLRRDDVEPNVVAEAAMNETVLELVRAGVGCTIATSSSVATVVGRGAVVLEIVGRPESHIVLVTRRGQSLTPAARAFRELAERRHLS